MKLSVIILNYNVRYFLQQCILSVQRSIRDIDAEIIVVDNNSADDSCKMMQTTFPAITLIDNKENVGFSKANNQAVAIAKGEYVCILNPDTVVVENCFNDVLSYVETIKKAGALGTCLVDGTGSFLPESKRNLPTPIVSLQKLLGIKKNSYYVTDVAVNERGKAPVLVGAFMLLKRDVYQQVGGFDEDYFMYGEDIDLSYKLEQAGYVNHYMGDVNTLHYKGESTSKDKIYLDRFYGAMQIFYKKHFNHNILIKLSVYLGLFASKSLANFSNSHKKNRVLSSKQAYIFTDDLLLLGKISTALNKEIKASSMAMLQDMIIYDSLLIFDADYLSYSSILNYMRQMSGKGNTYRIKPPGCNFLLGSDQSDDKGNVVVF